jgi:hypothetical protein
MTEAFVAEGQNLEAYDCYEIMKQAGFKPDKVTFVSLLNAFTNPGLLPKGQKVHSEIVEAGLELEPRVGTSLVGMYAKCGNVPKAQEIFDRMDTWKECGHMDALDRRLCAAGSDCRCS